MYVYIQTLAYIYVNIINIDDIYIHTYIYMYVIRISRFINEYTHYIHSTYSISI